MRPVAPAASREAQELRTIQVFEASAPNQSCTS